MVVGDPEEVVELLVLRHDVLAALRRAPRSKPALQKRLSLSRSTVDRAVRELEAAGLVERGPDGVRLLLPGRLAVDGFSRFFDSVDGVCRAGPIVEGLPADVALDCAVLADADVVLPEPHAPHRPVKAFTGLLDRADSIRAYTPAYVPEIVDAYYDAIVGRGVDAEFVVTGDVLDGLVSEYADEFAAALDVGMSIRRTDVHEPYSLTLVDTPDDAVLTLMVYRESGARGLVQTDAADALDWGREQYQSLRDAAERVEGP